MTSGQTSTCIAAGNEAHNIRALVDLSFDLESKEKTQAARAPPSQILNLYPADMLFEEMLSWMPYMRSDIGWSRSRKTERNVPSTFIEGRNIAACFPLGFGKFSSLSLHCKTARRILVIPFGRVFHLIGEGA